MKNNAPSSESAFRTLVEHSRDAVFIMDQLWHLRYVNFAAVTGLGFGTSEELLAKGPLELIHPADRQAAMMSIGPALAGAAATKPPLEERFIRKDGSLFVVEVAHLGVTFDGAPAVAMIASDAAEWRELHGNLHAAEAEAEKASRVKGAFLTNMSHELRTPLNGVLGFAKLLRGEHYGRGLDVAQRGFVDDILEAAGHMLSLVNDLLDLRRAQSSRPDLVAAEIALLPIVEKALRVLRPVIEDRGQTVTMPVTGDLPKIRADGRAVLQILINLVGNAAKYTPVAGAIIVRAAREGAFVRVEVEDNGPGIALEHHERVFEYFTQLGAKRALGMRGSGLGLALTKQLVEAMGGAVFLRSVEGEGSTFGFTVPCASPISA